MKNVLNGNLKVWHLLVVGMVLILTAGGTIALADSEAISTLWPQGTVLMASASSSTNLTTNETGPKVEVLSIAFDIPPGKRGDLHATFTGFLQHNSGTYSFCFGEFRFDSETGVPLNPNKDGSYQLYGGETAKLPSQITSTFTGSKKGLKPGHYVLKAYLSSSYATCNVYERNMNILVNLR